MAGASMKDIKLRIKSVESTMQITKAMQLVATSKLRRAKERMEMSKPFAEISRKAIMAAVKESFACEVVARRSAMDSAGKNATTMIDNLQLKYNRARQGAITQEITEIVAGSGE